MLPRRTTCCQVLHKYCCAWRNPCYVLRVPKPKAPLTTWLIRHRKSRGMGTLDIAKAIGVADTTVRGWESGRGIGADNLPALESLFGELAPDHLPVGDQAALVAAINALVDELRLERAAQRESTDAILRAIAATVGAPAPQETRAGSGREALVGTPQ